MVCRARASVTMKKNVVGLQQAGTDQGAIHGVKPWHHSWVRVSMLVILVWAVLWLGGSVLSEYKLTRLPLYELALCSPLNGVMNGLASILIVVVVAVGIWHSLNKFDPDRHTFKLGWLEYGGKAEAKEIAALNQRIKELDSQIASLDQAIARGDARTRQLALNWLLIVEHISLLAPGASREQIVYALNTICSASVDAFPDSENLRVSVWLLSADRKKVRLKAGHAVPHTNRTFWLSPSRGFAPKIIATGHPKVVTSWENVTEDDFVTNESHKSRPRSIIGCEVSVMIDSDESRCIGAFCISEDGSDHARRFTETDIPVVRFYAQAVTTVLTICKRLNMSLS